MAGYRRYSFIFLALVAMSLIGACQTSPPKPPITNTLHDIDIIKGDSPKESVFIKPKTKAEIRAAYDEYLKHAVVDEKTRLYALTRLAELEYNDNSPFEQDNPDKPDEETQSPEEKLYYQRLQRTIDLLSTSVRDYPDAKGNDSLLYQLAKAQAQNNQHDESIESLSILVEKFPLSPFYVESQFRIAEDAFSIQDYSAAEYAYSEVILSPENEIFYEKAMFKRGWARFKQQYYLDAIEDLTEAVTNHNFGTYKSLNMTDKDQFDEYFRAIALSFIYHDDRDVLAEYFKSRPDFRYSYNSYRVAGDLYLKQERFTDAVETHRHFIKHFPESDNIPYSYLKIIEIWKDSGFNQQIYSAIEDFYRAFNPASQYWVDQNENSKVNRITRRSLREYVVLMTGYFHNRYQSSQQNHDYRQSDKWYQRYLEHYQAYARQDNIYFLYGELLTQKNNNKPALNYYELAAFDNDQILHKESAYAAIVLSNNLFIQTNEKTYLDRYINYSKHFSRQYSGDSRGFQVLLDAAEQAYLNKEYANAIELADLSLANNKQANPFQATQIKASAYFSLNEFEESETLYTALITANSLNRKQYREFKNNLALSIYRLAETAINNDDIARAIHHFARISNIVPDTEIAASGLYDAIASNMKHRQWKDAITQIKRFQAIYPRHKFSNDVSKKLSVAYLSSNQGIKAAVEFEKIAQTDSNHEVKAAAQWQAATIYEEKAKFRDAIKAYQKYAASFKKPYAQKLEAMAKVASLYTRIQSPKSSRNWYAKIIKEDERALNNMRTDSSRQITSAAYLELARYQMAQFDSIKLTLPLKKSLRRKKAAMQKSVRLFGRAALNKIYDITTEATYSIGNIYDDFSQALLSSDRPSNLNEEELDQYEILLEDQAFPFEDKSIEFFEINLARIKDGLYNDWIAKSLKELKSLFPARYDRKPKLDDYVFDMR